MAKTRVIVNSKRAEKKVKMLREKLEKEGELALTDATQFGKQYAISIAPKYTGVTAKSIRGRTNRNDLTSRIFTVQNSNDGPRPRRGEAKGSSFKNFNLIRWMHTSPKAPSHIHSGKYNFMELTKKELRKTFGAKVTGRWRNVVMKINKQ